MSMNREQELQSKLDELKRVKNKLIDKIGDSLIRPVQHKAQMWDALVPFMKKAIEDKMHNGAWNIVDLSKILTEKAFQTLCGEDFFTDIEKI